MTNDFKSPHVDDRRDFGRLVRRVGEAMTKHLNDRPTMPVDYSEVPAEIRRELGYLPLPADGMGPDEILTIIEDKIMPWSMPTNQPRSYAWVNTSPAPISILSEGLARTLNNVQDGYDRSSTLLMQGLGR